MKKYKCTYLDNHGCLDDESPDARIDAASAEEAAQIYSQRYPSHNLRIDVTWGIVGGQVIANSAPEQREEISEGEIAVEQASPQATSPKGDSSLPAGHYIAVFGDYSIGVSKSEPLVHRILRWATVLAFVPWIINAIALFAGNSEIEGMDRLILVWNGLISVMLFWGAAQLVQFFHSIAWNTQEARRERIES